MKEIKDIDQKFLKISDEDKIEKVPSVLEVLRLIGNVKADTADNARRTRRLIVKLREKDLKNLLLENDDLAFLVKTFETNGMSLTAWFQGQILDLLDSAETVVKKD